MAGSPTKAVASFSGLVLAGLGFVLFLFWFVFAMLERGS